MNIVFKCFFRAAIVPFEYCLCPGETYLELLPYCHIVSTNGLLFNDQKTRHRVFEPESGRLLNIGRMFNIQASSSLR